MYRTLPNAKPVPVAGLVVAVACLLSATEALARPDVRQLECDQAQALVREAGALVVTTGDHTYRRFVAAHGFCDAGERFLHPAFTPTADNRSCRIGYTCESWSLFIIEDD